MNSPGLSTVEHHLSAFADTCCTRAPWVGTTDNGFQRRVNPTQTSHAQFSRITHGTRTARVYAVHKPSVPILHSVTALLPDTGHSRTEPSPRSLFTHKLHGYFHHNLTFICIRVFAGFSAPPGYRESALKTILPT